MTEDERLLRVAEVERLAGLHRATIYQMMARDEFPRPIRLGAKAVRWKLSELAKYIDNCPRADGDG